jgi:5-methylcytosine-specific restriction endonuclease McrBC GTP-binding regulatory subunit McrB
MERLPRELRNEVLKFYYYNNSNLFRYLVTGWVTKTDIDEINRILQRFKISFRVSLESAEELPQVPPINDIITDDIIREVLEVILRNLEPGESFSWESLIYYMSDINEELTRARSPFRIAYDGLRIWLARGDIIISRI